MNYKCEKCGTELKQEMYNGMVIKTVNSVGEWVYSMYCPKCGKHYKIK
jgi:uncharacterized protein with PIN domain